MKKLIIILLAICLLFAGIIGYLLYKDRMPKEENTASQETETESEDAGAVQQRHVDFEALYASHDPDEVIMTVDGKDITWQEYFYWFYYQASQIDSYFEAMSVGYGEEHSWDEIYADGGENKTYEEITKESAEGVLKEIYSIENFTEKNHIELSEESRTAIKDELQQDITSVCGEGATEEDFFTSIESMYMTRDIYERMKNVNYLYRDAYNEIYGPKGENVNDEDAVAYLADNDYIYANHILFTNANRETGETYDDDTMEEKIATAESIIKELRAIKDKDKLVQRFGELKEQYDDDTGKVMYPDGYVFTSGKMVAEFEQASRELGEYEISDPIETAYGYHVIIRLPISADTVMDYTNTGLPVTCREFYANYLYNKDMEENLNSVHVEYKKSYKDFSIMDYVK